MDVVRLLFSFKGRLNRARYLVVELALLALWGVSLSWHASLPAAWIWIAAVPMIWINMATTAKRLHDRNRSGWWTIAVFIVKRLSFFYYGAYFGLSFGVDVPLAGEMVVLMGAVVLSLLQTWIVIELFFLIGTDGPNRFGPDPTRTPRAPAAASPAPHGLPDFLVRRSGSVPRS